MDYLKYLLLSLVALILTVTVINSAGPGIAFAIIGITIGYMALYRPPAYAIGYTLWLIFFYFWHDYGQGVLTGMAAQDPQKYTAHTSGFVMGAWMVMGAIISHPICYYAGKLIIRAWAKSPIAIGATSFHLRRYGIIWFGGASMIGFLIVKVVEAIFEIPRHPYENYAVPCIFLIAAILAVYMVRKKSLAVKQ